MAVSVVFSRTSETSITCVISGAGTTGAYTYAVQVKSNTSGSWVTKTTASVDSNGRAYEIISVNDNSNYYCRVMEVYNSSGDTYTTYYPSSSGRLVYAYEGVISYSGTISLYSSGGHNNNPSYPYQGYVDVRVAISNGAGSGWFIRVNASQANTTYISSGGIYTITLDNLYDGNTSAYYTIYLYDPDGGLQDYITVYHRETPAQVLVPNVTSLSVTGVSSSGFTVTAAQNNLKAGSWGIQISTNSSFSNIVATSTQALATTRSLSYEFTGLSANTLYYIRVFNVYGGEYEYAGTWSRRTGIAPFAWEKMPEAGYVPRDAITAAKWNLLQEKISQVSARNGTGSVSVETVYAGERIMAADFNSVRAKLAALSGAGSLPGTKQKGDPLLAADFEGTASLKGAINRAIAALNN